MRNSFSMRRIATAAGIAALVVLAADAQSAARRFRANRSELTAPEGGALVRARGEVVSRMARRGGRQILTVTARGLEPGRRYELLADDPATPETTAEPFRVLTADANGRVRARFDTGSGDTLPFRATLRELAEKRFEVRDARGLLVLSGEIPAPQPRVAPADGCSFLEEVVFSDDFDLDVVGAAPTDWEVTGTEVAGITVLVDSTVADGGVGASVQIADTVALDPGSASLSHTFTTQDAFFATEFTLISGLTSGRLVMNVGDDTDAGTVFPTGFGTGLGLYEDGTIGFGVGDSIATSAPSTTYHFRVTFDLAADTFDVAIDGTTVVTDRALGSDFTAIDRITFGGAGTSTGTANVDSVRVLHLTQDCPPVADAGPDQVVECAGAETAVTLDGSLSADPDGATLTFAWTGGFNEATADGVGPTVHFPGVGTYTVTLTVSDGVTTATDDVVIDIQDTTGPAIVVTGLPTQLWPPNHQLIAMTPTVTITDACDTTGAGLTTTLTITSNESDNSTGDGNTTGDVVIRSATDFDLRAERAGPGSGRVYTLVWTATDSVGNSTTFETTVVVPHDQGHGDSVGSGDDDDADDDDADEVGDDDDDGTEVGDDDHPSFTPPGLVDNPGNGHGNAFGHSKRRHHRHRR